ncbi:hypothetical protein SK128_024607 [Halocaridina rubra]|uniref:Cytochrome P450 n=1 Tax=Halocaridina rubra TaxID=373956 RepID=A0AAN8X5S7_HALRR
MSLSTALFPSLSTLIFKYMGTGFTPHEKTVLQYVKNVIKKRMESPEPGKTVDALHFMLEAAQLISTEDERVNSSSTNGHEKLVYGSQPNNSQMCDHHSKSEYLQLQTAKDNKENGFPLGVWAAGTLIKDGLQHENSTHKQENFTRENYEERNCDTIKSQSKNQESTKQHYQYMANNKRKYMDVIKTSTDSNSLKHLPPKANKPKLSADEVAANAFLLLLAGYETTSSSLCFTAYLLATHPEVQEKLYEEICQNIKEEEELTYEKVGQLQYLDMVLNESLRCYPPAAGVVTREVDKDYECRGLKFPAKSYILLPIAYMHYNENLWQDPKKFDPERFQPSRRKDIPLGAFIPFGLGPRQCIGARFAITETKLAIARLIYRFRLEPCPLTEKQLKTKATILILAPASSQLYLNCFRR